MQRYIRMQARALLTWNRPYNKMCCQYGVSVVYTKQHAGSERCIHTTHQTVWYLKEYLSLPLVSTNNNERAKGCHVLYFIKKNVNQKTRAVDNFSIQRKSDTIWKFQFECASRLKTMLLFFVYRFVSSINLIGFSLWLWFHRKSFGFETRREKKNKNNGQNKLIQMLWCSSVLMDNNKRNLNLEFCVPALLFMLCTDKSVSLLNVNFGCAPKPNASK